MKALWCITIVLALALPRAARGQATTPARPPAAAPAPPAGAEPAAVAPPAPPAPPAAESPAESPAESTASQEEELAPSDGDPAEAGVADAAALTVPEGQELTLDLRSCEEVAATRRRRDGTLELPSPGEDTPAIQWTTWELRGTFIDATGPLREVLGDLLQRHRPFTDDSRKKLRGQLAELGYHLSAVDAIVDGAGTKLAITLEPRPLVRSVEVRTQVELGLSDLVTLRPFRTVVLDDEVARRMRLRAGTYLPWLPAERACEILREKQRIEEFLRSEGFFEAKADVEADFQGKNAARLRVALRLGPPYRLRVMVARPGTLALSEAEIRAQFGRERNCLLTIPVRILCDNRFTEEQFLAELRQLTREYRKRGFPSVRIVPNYDPRSSFERSTKTVDVTLTIDERRRIDVIFEGHDPNRFLHDKLLSLLTFEEVGSATDFEIQKSAAALTTYLQGRGHFDARVTWRRERFASMDHIIFRISAGPQRRVQRVEIRYVDAQGRLVDRGKVAPQELIDAIATRSYGNVVRLLSNTPPITAEQLEHDADRIARVYRKHGYYNTHVEVAAGPSPEALGSVAATLALASTTASDGDLYVRFIVEEGVRTTLQTVQLALPDASQPAGTAEDIVLRSQADRELCAQLLAALGDDQALGWRNLALAPQSQHCSAPVGIPYQEELRDKAADRVRGVLISQGRPDVEVEADPLDPRQAHLVLRLRVRHLEQRRLGRVILRGNFRTDSNIILRELGFRTGTPLTGDLASQGLSRLRATGLFNAVDVTYLEGGGDLSHAVVRVEERFDARMQLDLEAGASYLNGRDANLFTKVRVALPNLWGKGITLDTAATLGTQQIFLDTSVRIPSFLVRWSPVAFDTELSAFLRQQDTDRFGSLLTQGLTLASSRTWQRNSVGGRAARALSTALRYDFRLRDRQLETIRPAGTDSAESRIPVTTRTGALALTFEWEQRVTQKGTLSPLAPEDGFRLQASISVASPYLLGQDTFLKLSAGAQAYWPLSPRLLVRTDLRYDHGIPLGGEVVLPEVERFFAGGDSTVRGYDEDRLATEIIEEAVPPFSDITQLRVLAAGGNIRALTSVDAQLKVYKSVASAVFLDAGVVTNDWRAAGLDDIRPGTGMAVRYLFPFGAVSLEYAIPLRTKLGDDPRGRIHFGFAMRFD